MVVMSVWIRGEAMPKVQELQSDAMYMKVQARLRELEAERRRGLTP